MFEVSFIVQQSLDGKLLKIIDQSILSAPDDAGNMSSRHFSVLLADGSFLGASNSISMPIGSGNELDIPILKDYAVAITITYTPIMSHDGSVYTKRQDYALINNAKAKLFAREYKLDAALVNCSETYADVDYSIIRWIDDAGSRFLQSDQLGSQKFLDKIDSIGINDCTC